MRGRRNLAFWFVALAAVMVLRTTGDLKKVWADEILYLL